MKHCAQLLIGLGCLLLSLSLFALTPSPDIQQTAASCHADLNRQGYTDAALQAMIAAKARASVTSLFTQVVSCNLLNQKIVMYVLATSAQPLVIMNRQGVRNSLSITPAALCSNVCLLGCNASVSLMANLTAIKDGCFCTPQQCS